MDNLTPMLKQYHKIKQQYPDYILFFRLGDFYEMFYEDAGVAGYSGFLRIDGSVNLNPNISTGVGINTTSPFTWGTGDFLGGMFRYPLGV